jgi:outer membrane immunogenic protein
MKRTLLAGIALAATAWLPAFAADIRAAPVYKAPTPVAATIYNWTGFYVGGNAGYEWTDGTSYPLSGTQSIPPLGGFGILSAQGIGLYPLTSNLGQKGAIGGVQAGYNWQFNSIVAGVEADFDLASVKQTASTFASAGIFSGASNISRRLEDLGTVRARVGWAIDRTLLYATGGLAYGRSKLGYSANLSSIVTGTAASSTTVWQAGWTAGAGIEYGWEHWSAKAEYLYYDLGTQSTTIGTTTIGDVWTGTATVRNNGQLVRVGLNYKL